MSPRDANYRLTQAQKLGFWIGTKRDPRRAVRRIQAVRKDGKQSTRGRLWVEILPYDEYGNRDPERFNAADVEHVGPHEWLTYYPHPDEPVCGWGRPRLPEGGMQFCPRPRREGQDGKLEAFCPQHMRELRGEEQDHES